MTPSLKVHPISYKKLKTPFILFTTRKVSSSQFDEILTELKGQSILSIHIEKVTKTKDWRYILVHPKFCLRLAADHADKRNFSIISVETDNRSLYKYNNPHMEMFYIEVAAGIQIVNGNTLYSITEGTSLSEGDWSMDREEYNSLIKQMRFYHDNGDYNTNDSDIKISRTFEESVLNPFKYYTEKERRVEEDKVASSDGITFERCEFIDSNARSSIFAFYSSDPNADPEKALLNVGNRVTLFDSEGKACHSGQIFDIDAETEEAVKFSVEFLFQINVNEIPTSGKMVMAYNDTQDRVRERVINGIESGNVASKYMYKTFRSFRGDGYFAPDYTENETFEQGRKSADMAEYLAESLSEKYPPNQMQLEAIIKGILTKDMLLVLGPPGTGKTTVILAWVNYFVKKGMRVLISSQNNAAVDNVLERLDPNINIIRLGQKTKIQDNCTQFMPMYKLSTMVDTCKANNARIISELKEDLKDIAEYKKLLLEFKRLTVEYTKVRELIAEDVKEIRECISLLDKEHRNIKDALKKLEFVVSSRARKIIFLEHIRKKSVFSRMLNKSAEKRAVAELNKTNQELMTVKKEYEVSVEKYNETVEKLKVLISQIREKGAISKYTQAFSALSKFAIDKIIHVDENKEVTTICGLNLKSELRTLYNKAQYSKKPLENEEIINRELESLEKIENSAKELEFAIEKWKEAVNQGGNEIFEEILLTTCQVVGATCIGINSNRKFANIDFDVAIVDESGQIQIHNAMVPLSRAPKALMLGDYKQIPPCASDEVITACEHEGIDTKLLKKSFFEFLFEKMRSTEIDRIVSAKKRLDTDEDSDDSENENEYYEEAKGEILKPVLEEYGSSPADEISREEIKAMVETVTKNGKKIVNLNRQFRMPAHISDVISEWFYESNYFSSYDINNFKPLLPNTTKPMVIINTAKNRGRFEKQPANKMGYFNEYEANLVADIIEQVIASQHEEEREKYINKPSELIGVISAYGAQVRTIREVLQKRDLGISNNQIHGMVASLDSFQGQERDLIIYSLTRSKGKSNAKQARVGFMKELRRLNVAFTRSKKQLVIIGDIDYLKECLYMKLDEDANIEVPCQTDKDDIITQEQINQCAECPIEECERKFARFIKLLMQHVEDEENAAGNLINSKNLLEIIKGGDE